ncbi:MAG: hypothetical protein NT039_00355 [Candidatus Berkelbacteria bacterium]|nr:hypothetical protein [Candidatus Berkelbacteria bacterium]
MIINFMPGPEGAPGEGRQGMGPEQGEEPATPPPEAPREAAAEQPAEREEETRPTRAEEGEREAESNPEGRGQGFLARTREGLEKAMPVVGEAAQRAILFTGAVIGSMVGVDFLYGKEGTERAKTLDDLRKRTGGACFRWGSQRIYAGLRPSHHTVRLQFKGEGFEFIRKLSEDPEFLKRMEETGRRFNAGRRQNG